MGAFAKAAGSLASLRHGGGNVDLRPRGCLRLMRRAAAVLEGGRGALLKAGSRSNEAVATAMNGLAVDQVNTLQAAHKAVDGALAAPVAAVTPAPAEPEKKLAKA